MMVDLLLFKKKKSRRTVDYNFASGSLPSGVTLARASSGTRFNASGVMVSEAANAPRFDYDPVTLALRGLLVEPQRTNLIPYSRFSGGWGISSGVTRVNKAAVSPDGTTNAVSLSWNAGVSAYIGESASYSTASHTASLYARSLSGSNKFRIEFKDTIYRASGDFVTDITWGRFIFTQSLVAFNNGNFVIMRSSDLSAVSIYAFGAQIEQGASATSYIPTSGSAVTRSADVVQFTIPSGVATLRYTFDDNSTQDVAVSAGAYTVPTNLNRPHIKSIQSV